MNDCRILLRYLAFLVLFCLPFASFAQKTVTGTVTNTSDKTPVVGASIIVKGQKTGAQTNIQGQFSINVSEGQTLVITSVGFTPVEVKVGNESSIMVAMEVTATKENEVVVVGYGTQKKTTLTGAVTTVKMDDILGSRPVSNTAAALQGEIPGLQITTGSGQPGATINMSLRGLSSLSYDPRDGKTTTVYTAPLVLMDNVPIDISDVNPADIESLTILKDASASAIYGARAAYGVILITTKKGTKGQTPRINYSNSLATTEASTLAKKATPLQFLQALKDFGNTSYWTVENNGLQKWEDLIKDYQKNPGAYPANGIAKSNGYLYPLRETDLLKELFPGGSEQIHNLAVSGGSEKTTYRVSLGYANEDGIMVSKNDSYKRYTVNADFSADIAPWMTTSFNTYYKNDNKVNPPDQPDAFYTAMTFAPMAPIGWDTVSDGRYLPYESPANRIKIEAPEHNVNDYMRLFGKMEVRPFKGMKLIGELTYSNDINNNNFFRGINTYISAKNEIRPYSKTSFTSRLYNIKKGVATNIYGNYSKQIGDHGITALLGFNREENHFQQAYTIINDVISATVPSISASSGTVFSSDAYRDFVTEGFFGRINYDYKGRYLLEASARYDGSSRFPNGHRWVLVPSASVGWVLTKEAFMKPLTNTFSLVKLRASYGSIGNQDIDNYSYLASMDPVNASWINPGANVPYKTVLPPALVRTDFTWEIVKTLNFGLDLGLFKGKLNTTFNWFNRITEGVLGPGAVLPGVLGTGAPLQNARSLSTNGWEWEASWRDVTTSGLYYSIGFNLSDNQTKITKCDNPTNSLSDYYKGQKIGEIWGYETQGFFTKEDFPAGTIDDKYKNTASGQGKPINGIAPFTGVKQNPGDIRYVDLNRDSIINTGKNTLADPGDRKIIGNSNRRFQFGINGTVGYKNFDFSFFAQGIGKRDLWISNAFIFPYQSEFYGIFSNQLDYWTPTNQNAYLGRIYEKGGENSVYNRAVQTKFLTNGAYLRMKNLTLGYTVPAQVLSKAHLKKFRVYVSGENVFTLNHTPDGFDTELSDISQGGVYPIAKKFSLGINLTF